VAASLFRALASAERAVVLFFDDLHWSDDGTLRMFEYLALHAAVPHLLVIGSFRDDEGAAQHLPEMAAGQQGVDCIALQPFAVADVAALLSDLLHDDRRHVEALAGLIASKTYGNPYFTIKFILALAQEGLVAFRSDGTCAWELAPIEAKGYTNNVVDLLLGQIKLLPMRCRKTMHLLSSEARMCARLRWLRTCRANGSTTCLRRRSMRSWCSVRTTPIRSRTTGYSKPPI
jgi:predicted ATPase